LSIGNNCFPDKLKEAQVTPIFKKEWPINEDKLQTSFLSVLPIFF
jgi:hypothetical protein